MTVLKGELPGRQHEHECRGRDVELRFCFLIWARYTGNKRRTKAHCPHFIHTHIQKVDKITVLTVDKMWTKCGLAVDKLWKCGKPQKSLFFNG